MRVQKGYPKLIKEYWLGCDTYSVVNKIISGEDNGSLMTSSSIVTLTLAFVISLCLFRH
jgi:hypothetical protein